MKHKILLLLIVCLTTSQFAFSQIKFSFGPEIGINSSGLPHWNKYIVKERNDKVKKTYLPVVSPVIGLWTKVNFGNHLFTNLGVQYMWVGSKYHYHRDGNDLLYHETYTSDEWENQTFQKLSILLSIGYNVKIKNVKANIFLGYRENYFTGGRYYNKSFFLEGKNHPINIERIKQLNPFDKTQFTLIAKRWNSGLFIGLGSDLTKKINLALSYSNNPVIFYCNSYGWEGYCYEYNNGDITLTIKYAFK